jgi:hypothetical protein
MAVPNFVTNSLKKNVKRLSNFKIINNIVRQINDINYLLGPDIMMTAPNML